MILKIALLCASFLSGAINAYNFFDFTPSYDFHLQHAFSEHNKNKWGFFCESIQKNKARNYNNQIVSPLQIYEEKQNIFFLVDNVESSKFEELHESLFSENSSEGGYEFTPTGLLSGELYSFFAGYYWKHGLSFSLHVPVYSVILKNVQWEYAGIAGKNKQSLTNAFFYDMEYLFSFKLDGWERKEIGDVTALIDWKYNFYQKKPWVKSVQPCLRAGMVFPTSKQSNPNQILYHSFGHEKSFGLPFGGGIDIIFKNGLEFGFRGQFWYYWGAYLNHRIRTSALETELLLPKVERVFKDFGFIQNFSLHACYRYLDCVKVQLVYDYMKKGEDSITVINKNYDYLMINTSKQLDETYRHAVMMTIGLDGSATDQFLLQNIQCELFVKFPFHGTYVVTSNTAGFSISLSF